MKGLQKDLDSQLWVPSARGMWASSHRLHRIGRVGGAELVKQPPGIVSVRVSSTKDAGSLVKRICILLPFIWAH